MNGAVLATIFTLPTGYRPTKDICISSNRNNAAADVCIFTTGEIEQSAGLSTGGVLLDGLTFRAGTG